MKKSIIIIMTLGLIIASGTAYAATVDLQGINTVSPAQGSFFFNVKISDAGSLPNWDSWVLSLVLTGSSSGAKFANFNNVVTNPDYVFFNDSGEYLDAISSPSGTIGIATDFTNSGNGVIAAVGDLLAKVTVDVSNTQAGETYTISLPLNGNLYQDTLGNAENFTQLQPDYSFQVVPIPAAVWLLGGGLIGLVGLKRKFNK